MAKTFVEKKNKNIPLFRWLLLFTILTHLAGLYQFAAPMLLAGNLFGSPRWSAAVIVNASLIIIEIILFCLTWGRFGKHIFRGIHRIALLFSSISWGNLILLVLANVLFTFLALSPTGQFISGSFTRLFLFWSITLAGAFWLRAWNIRAQRSAHLGWIILLSISLLINGFLFTSLSYFQDISRYPFTLSWSETSRYYYASLFFSERIYGASVSPTVLHPSRYLMQSVPFILSHSPLWLHRAWQVFLWITMTLTTAYFIAWRSGIQKKGWLWTGLVMAWAFVFLLVGPVYYHLQVPLILVLWGFNRGKSHHKINRFILNVLVILVASAWAGISRVNWFPVPGLLAATLIFIERPITAARQEDLVEDHPFKLFDWPTWRYGLEAVGWAISGAAVAFFAQSLYILWSGNSTKEFASSFSSDLLWHRLWPSSTYHMGILPGALLASLPLFLLIWGKLREQSSGQPNWKRIHPIRLLGLGTVLFVLFIGGLVVSVKIGGGSNLHNLDAYLALLLISATLFAFDQIAYDRSAGTAPSPLRSDSGLSPQIAPGNGNLSWLLNGRFKIISLALCLVVPIGFTLYSRGPMAQLPDSQQINRGLSAIIRAIEEIEPQNRDILFLSDRHLLTFGYVQGVTLIPDYERVFLMEMAMANNREYLEKFHKKLAEQRFKLIISEPLFIQEKGQRLSFGEENDAWVREVSEYILCYYKSKTFIKPVRIQILIPRENPLTCP